MEKRFRLKKEAVQFFSEKLATAIGDYRFWKVYNVDDNALEEVEAVVIEYVQKTSPNTRSLGGWDKDGTELLFTLKFPSMTFYENDKFTKGRSVRELMNRLQVEANSYMLQFLDPNSED